jgi:hypothetical protein
VKVQIEVSQQIILNALANAFNGSAIAYWARIDGIDEPHNWGKPLVAIVADGWGVPISCRDRPGRNGHVTLSTIGLALEAMAKQYPEQFGKFLAGRGDNETVDILIQLAVLGEHVYG